MTDLKFLCGEGICCCVTVAWKFRTSAEDWFWHRYAKEDIDALIHHLRPQRILKSSVDGVDLHDGSGFGLFDWNPKMGVITRSDTVICKGNSVESLHISTEQSENEQESRPDTPVVSPQSDCRARAFPTSFANVRKRLGKKKSRRYQDAKELMTLVEEDDFGEVAFDDLVPNTNTNFSVLFQDSSSMLLWRVFLSSSDEVQQHFIKGDTVKVDPSPVKPTGKVLTGDQAYCQIESGLRSILRKTKPCLELLSYLERMLVKFFSDSPTGKFVSGNMTSFERLLCHAICQYHSLSAQSYDVTEPEPGRAIRIRNRRKYFTSPEILLGEYLGAKQR